MKNTTFYKQAQLLIRILPLIKHKHFALKGGTAINFFVRDMPRISVDIDLIYTKISDRESALNNISAFLVTLSDKISKIIPSSRVVYKKMGGSNIVKSLIVRYMDATVKIEPNFIIRGTVFPVQNIPLCKKAQEFFEIYIEATILSIPDLYGGKICAALDRQHPRDLFDIKLLLGNEGITDEIRKAFIVYLISHNRPIEELLDPSPVDLKDLFENAFSGMTDIDISYEEIISTRKVLIKIIRESLTTREKKFLLSIQDCNPLWDLLDNKQISTLPAVKWKMLNLNKMDNHKRKSAYQKLLNLFEIEL